MEQNVKPGMKQMMVVLSMEEEWSMFKSVLQDSFTGTYHQLSSSCLGPNEAIDLKINDRLTSFHYTVFKQDMTEEGISQALDNCVKSCTNGIRTFLLLIQSGLYTKKERRMVDTLQANFGPEAVKLLIVLSLELEAVVGVPDDALLDLINLCDGRYFRIRVSSSTSDELGALPDMAEYMVRENGPAGYTDSMWHEAKQKHTEDASMKILRQKLQEAEKNEEAFKQLVEQNEQSRRRELEGLKSKHAEERKKEDAERRAYAVKRESLEEAVRSHGAMLQLQMNSNDNDTKKISVVLLGLSGSGKTSARNVILQRAGNQYSLGEHRLEAPLPTMACERKEVCVDGDRIILVDTPELWDEDGVEDLELVKDCLALSLPGPHVFLLVFQVGRFTQGENEMTGHIQKIFGREFTQHMIILFTLCDDHHHKAVKISDYVAGAHASLRDIVLKCGSRFHALNVGDSRSALSYPQVKELISGVRKLVASHGGGHYSVRGFTTEELKKRKKAMEERLVQM